MDKVFIGSEALARGAVTRYELARWHRAIYPDVYVAERAELSLRDRTVGAWLWSRRRAVVAGAAASALHGARWVDAGEPIELIWKNGRPPATLIVRNDTVASDEITQVAGVPVTTAARTAFDLGGQRSRPDALMRLDALTRATALRTEDVVLLAKRHPHARGLRRLRAVLPLVDPGAESPKETWLRLLLIDAGLPAPSTQIPIVHNWRTVGVLDMGWEEQMVAVDYEGRHHQTDRGQYARDISRLERLRTLGWLVVRVIAEDHPDRVVERVQRAMESRGWHRAPRRD